ncbi:flavodoxin family protein [Pseudonocardia sp. HH130630-07]|uniref:flavodoxin family protein n=1 Tax=Pseudonocardia sp. HH130630-07 TaxID=1690815 RepID=UPI000814E134|nr:NAD(P)H-dependent oxidoreductase [Pseudonocardia sp. HH130630-07]ANY07515.1 flavodoxin [Pseudonocardia sp. HH130630-07]
MTTLLIVHHTPSPGTAELLDAVQAGAADPEISGVRTVSRAALAATASDLLAADAVLLGTPAAIGYMSGALKHFLDQVYYVCGDDTRGLPYGLWVHGGSDTSGATRSVTRIAEGMGWTAAAAPVELTGPPDAAARDRCRELGAVLAATVMPDG